MYSNVILEGVWFPIIGSNGVIRWLDWTGSKSPSSNSQPTPPAQRLWIREYSLTHTIPRHRETAAGSGFRLWIWMPTCQFMLFNKWQNLVHLLSWVLISFMHDLDLNLSTQKKRPTEHIRPLNIRCMFHMCTKSVWFSLGTEFSPSSLYTGRVYPPTLSLAGVSLWCMHGLTNVNLQTPTLGFSFAE